MCVYVCKCEARVDCVVEEGCCRRLCNPTPPPPPPPPPPPRTQAPSTTVAAIRVNSGTMFEYCISLCGKRGEGKKPKSREAAPDHVTSCKHLEEMFSHKMITVNSFFPWPCLETCLVEKNTRRQRNMAKAEIKWMSNYFQWKASSWPNLSETEQTIYNETRSSQESCLVHFNGTSIAKYLPDFEGGNLICGKG